MTDTRALPQGRALVREARPRAASTSVVLVLAGVLGWPLLLALATGQWQALTLLSCLGERAQLPKPSPVLARTHPML